MRLEGWSRHESQSGMVLQLESLKPGVLTGMAWVHMVPGKDLWRRQRDRDGVATRKPGQDGAMTRKPPTHGLGGSWRQLRGLE
jgi:hypothetical protein